MAGEADEEKQTNALHQIFVGKKLQRTSVEQIATEVENALFSYKGCSRALSYQFKENDVVVISGLRTGGNQVLNIVNKLMYPEKDMQVKAIPWPEHKSMDNFPRNYEPPKRLFKTMMSYSTLHNTVVNKPGVKFITVLRDPCDYYGSMFNFIQKLYEKSRSMHRDNKTNFEEVYHPDAFIDTEPTLVHHPGQGSLSYESNLAAWWAVRDQPNVLLVAYEQLVHDPERVVETVEEFLGLPGPSRRKGVAGAVTRESRSLPFLHSFHGCEPVVGFSKELLSLEARAKLRQRWKSAVFDSQGEDVSSYRKLYSVLTQEEYPVPDYDFQDGVDKMVLSLEKGKQNCCTLL